MNTEEMNILITGTHRSGTTWVGRTIEQTRKVNYIHEPFNVAYPNAQLAIQFEYWYTHYESSPRQREIEIAFDRLFLRNIFSRSVDACWREGAGVKMPARFLKHLTRNILNPRILVKDPIALLSAGWLYEKYDLDVVCMIRSPVAFAGSLKKAGWDFDFAHLHKQKLLMRTVLRSYASEINSLANGSGDFIDRICLLWNVLHHVILDYQDRYPAWLFVKHEDLVNNSLPEFERIFSHLKLNMNEDIIKYISDFTSGDNLAETTSTEYQPRNAKESLDNWKMRLSSEEVDRVLEATRNLAGKL